MNQSREAASKRLKERTRGRSNLARRRARSLGRTTHDGDDGDDPQATTTTTPTRADVVDADRPPQVC